MKPERTEPQQTRFQPGQSGNPAGRPKGARNRSTVAALSLLEGEAEALTRKAVELALAGDATALRLCLERLVPPAKERPIPPDALDLPPLEGRNYSAAVVAVVEATAAGRLTLAEGQALTHLLERTKLSILSRKGA